MTKTTSLPDSLAGLLKGVVFLPPGMEVDFGFTEAAVRGLGGNTLVAARDDPPYLVGGAMYDAVSSAAGDASATGAVFTLIALEQCANDFVKSSDVVSAAVTLLQCAGDHAELAGRTFIELAASNPKLDSQTLASHAVLLEKALMVVGAAKLGSQIGELLSDLRLVAAARELHAYAKAKKVPPSFYGDWYVHGTQYHFDPNGTGLMTRHAGFTDNNDWVDEVDTLGLSLSSDGSTLTVVITGQRWQVRGPGGETLSADPGPGFKFADQLGERFQLRFVKPNLMRSSVNSDGSSLGNPYICGPRTAPADQSVCGA